MAASFRLIGPSIKGDYGMGQFSNRYDSVATKDLRPGVAVLERRPRQGGELCCNQELRVFLPSAAKSRARFLVCEKTDQEIRKGPARAVRKKEVRGLPDGTRSSLYENFEGESALSGGRATKAISPLQEAVPTVRRNSSWQFFIESESLADAYERGGDPQKAVQVLERASQAKSIAYDNAGSTGHHWLRVRWRLAQLYRKLGRIDETQKIEADLSKILAYADSDHPMLLQLSQLRANNQTQATTR